MNKIILLIIFVSLCFNCVSISTEKETDFSLMEAIEHSSDIIVNDLPSGSRVAIIAFDTEIVNLSNFIIEEIIGALFDRGIEVADRQNLSYIFNELGFQMSGNVSDEAAMSVGKFLGAELVITGQLQYIGDSYRYRVSAIHVEKSTRDSITRLTVRNDLEMQRLVDAISSQTIVTNTTTYGLNEHFIPNTAGTFLDRGIFFASICDYEIAIDYFTEALRLNPNMSPAYVLRGRSLFASVSYITNVSDNFSNVKAIISQGQQISADQLLIYEQAIEDFSHAIHIDPNNAHIYFERGRIYLFIGETDRAINNFNQAIRLNPYYTSAYSERGLTYSMNGNNDLAIADFDRVIRLEPNSTTYNNRGNVFMEIGEIVNAISDYTQAILLNPNHAIAYFNRGNAYRRLRDYDSAIKDYDQAIRLDPSYPYAYGSRGLAYYNKMDYERAIADYNRLIHLDPNDANAYVARGMAYAIINDNERAKENYQTALRMDPNNSTARRNLENINRILE